jgi:hypothetical protein
MELKPIMLSDKKAAILVVGAIIDIKQQVGKILLSCNEIVVNILTHNAQNFAECEPDLKSAQSKVVQWRNELGDDVANSSGLTATYHSNRPFIICSEKQVAKLIVEAMGDVDELINLSIRYVNASNCSLEEKRNYLPVCGYLHGFAAGKRISRSS